MLECVFIYIYYFRYKFKSKRLVLEFRKGLKDLPKIDAIILIKGSFTGKYCKNMIEELLAQR